MSKLSLPNVTELIIMVSLTLLASVSRTVNTNAGWVGFLTAIPSSMFCCYLSYTWATDHIQSQGMLIGITGICTYLGTDICIGVLLFGNKLRKDPVTTIQEVRNTISTFIGGNK